MQIEEQIKMEAEKQAYSQDGDDKYQSGYECGFLSCGNLVLELMGWVKVEDGYPKKNCVIWGWNKEYTEPVMLWLSWTWQDGARVWWLNEEDPFKNELSISWNGEDGNIFPTHYQVIQLPPPPKD